MVKGSHILILIDIHTAECSTLSHEKIQSDHIAIFFEADFDLTESGPSIRVVRPIIKADWVKWKDETESQFEDFEAQSSGNLEENYARFCELLQDTMDTVIPQKTVKIRQHAARPCLWNEEVKEAKAEMNSCKNKDKLVEAESNLEEVFCLFDLILYVPSTICQLYRDGSSWVEPVLS